MAAIWEGKSVGLIPVWVGGPMQMASRTNAVWGVASIHRALPEYAEPPAELVGYYCLSNPPGSAGGSEKALAIRMKEKLLLVR